MDTYIWMRNDENFQFLTRLVKITSQFFWHAYKAFALQRIGRCGGTTKVYKYMPQLLPHA